MRLGMKIRAQEWLADRFRWVPYPDVRREILKRKHPKPSLWWRYKMLTWRQAGWLWFWVFFTIVGLMEITGPGAESGV